MLRIARETDVAKLTPHGWRDHFQAEVEAERDAIAGWIREAVEATRSGRSVAPAEDLALVAELQARLDEDPAFAAAWNALTPGRRRGYNIHFAKAKRSATRA